KARQGRRPEMRKFSTARWVCAPYRAAAGTETGPSESFSERCSLIGWPFNLNLRRKKREPMRWLPCGLAMPVRAGRLLFQGLVARARLVKVVVRWNILAEVNDVAGR